MIYEGNFDESFEELCCICDPTFIRRSYEEASLMGNETSKVFVNADEKKSAVYAIAVVDYDPVITTVPLPADVARLDLICANHQNKVSGAVKKLFSHVVSRLKKDGKRFLLLKVSPSNKRAVDFYKHLGFKRYKGYYIKELR